MLIHVCMPPITPSKQFLEYSPILFLALNSSIIFIDVTLQDRNMRRQIGRLLCQNRKYSWAQKLAYGIERIYKGYENLDYNFYKNGEAHLLSCISKNMQPKIVFDVGANNGEWALLAQKYFTEAQVYAFEIVPKTFQELEASCSNEPKINIHNVGLSDTEGEISVFCSPGSSGLSTCVMDFSEDFHGQETEEIKAKVIAGDSFCTQNNIASIDFLKIDVEGFEHKTLKGFEQLLTKNNIKVIQFEYGFINVETHFLLKDFYSYLEPLGYKIGKVYPDHIAFKDYEYTDENFYGPNYLAVHSSEKELIKALS